MNTAATKPATMSVADAFKLAIESRDHVAFGKILDLMRVKYRVGYEQAQQLAATLVPGFDADHFEDMCWRADQAESLGG